MLHENVVIVRFHVLQLPIREALVDGTHIVCGRANIKDDFNKLCMIICPKYVRSMRHIVPILLPPGDAQVLRIDPASEAIIHAEKSLQQVIAQILLTMHNIKDVAD